MAPIPSNAVEWARGAEGQIVAQPRIHALTGSATAACLGWRANQVVISPPDLVAMSPAGDARDRTLCWVMTQAVALRQQASSCTRVSVELNAEMLEADSFETAVQSAIVELRAGGVELELESARGPGGGGTASLRRLAKHGARLVFASLGSTAISVSRIRELPLSAIVLDSSVHAGLAQNLDVQASVRAWVAVGHHLSLEVVATEITRRDQLRWLLRNLGTEVQGDAVIEAMTLVDYDRWTQSSPRLVLSDLADVLEGKPRLLM
ncbi:MAG: EAL domain-containing protein [Polyangiaceae bacterium]|nr:EAL domain-containing protein [Polyangiaceae bacterium]